MDHFRYGLRYGYDFGELTGQVEVDFWSFSLRIDPSKYRLNKISILCVYFGWYGVNRVFYCQIDPSTKLKKTKIFVGWIK